MAMGELHSIACIDILSPINRSNIESRCVYFSGVAVETSLSRSLFHLNSQNSKLLHVASAPKMAKRQRKRGMAEPQAKAKPKSAPAPSLPSEWGSRYPRIAILFGIVAVSGSWLSAHWSPTVVWRCFDRINEWRRDAGLWPAVEMMAAECFFSDSIPLVSATLQHGKTLPELYRHYEKETAQHGLMLQTAKLPGVHAFYAEAGMGKSTVAAAVLQELYRQGVPAAFVVFEMPGELKRQVATSLQTTSDKLSDDLTGALVKLRKRGSREVVVVIDAIDEHDLTDMDTETLKLLAGVSWMSRGFELPVFFSVICLMRTLETKQRFEKMNGGHKITGGIATEPCPPVSPGTLQSYASQLQLANDDYKKWTDKAPYLIVLRHFAEGKYNMSKVVEHFEAVCYAGLVGERYNI